MSDFLRPIEFYQRRLAPIDQYIQQTSFYLSKMSGLTIEACKQHVTKTIKDPANGSVNPTVKYFERNDVGDKGVQELPLSEYLKTVIANDEILVPTYTSYLNSKQKPSVLVEFTDNNKKRRSIAKKEAFKAQASGQDELFIIKDNEQTNMKLYNNSMSGAFASEGSILNNQTAHNTLTSIIRSITAISNASNEKIIEGNRHYYNPDVTLYNLISLTANLDRDSLSAVIDKYQLVYPSVEDVIDCIKRSTDLYWRDFRAMDELKDFITRLDDVERAAIVYIGDMYHIRKHNDQFMRNLLKQLSRKVTDVIIDDALTKIHKVDELILNYAHQICLSEMRGNGKDYEKIPYGDVQTLLATCYNIVNTVHEYKDFIEAIFLTHNVPASTAYLPNMMRRDVCVSDTDSTMFAVDSWVVWYYDKLIINEESFALAGAVMFIATQCMAHGLALFSANMNVSRDKLFDLAMKPEFVFSVLCQTPVAKHYFTQYCVKEGNVLVNPTMEIKGVGLKSSAAPRSVMKHADEQMQRIIKIINNNLKISIINELKEVANLERTIKHSLITGEIEFFKQSMIKEPQSYANKPEQSPYLHHMLWQEVFEAKYGQIDPPPYSVIKIPTIVNNITSLRKWLVDIEDRTVAAKLEAWLTKHRKTSLPTMYLSTLQVQAFGIPEEIKLVIDVKRIILDLTSAQRLILDTIGYCVKDGYLVSELGY